MAHFAKVIDGVVIEVIVADQDFIDSGAVGDPLLWIQTSYNTRGGIYYYPNTNTPDPDQSKALRKNFAGIGDTYSYELDAFIPKKPFNSWVLNETTCLWESPIPCPQDNNKYKWNEQNQSWDLIENNI
jgi:hypothetical protein